MKDQSPYIDRKYDMATWQLDYCSWIPFWHFFLWKKRRRKTGPYRVCIKHFKRRGEDTLTQEGSHQDGWYNSNLTKHRRGTYAVPSLATMPWSVHVQGIGKWRWVYYVTLKAESVQSGKIRKMWNWRWIQRFVLEPFPVFQHFLGPEIHFFPEWNVSILYLGVPPFS